MGQEHSLELHYVYIVQCANNCLYTGYTIDVEQRIADHNAGKGGRYTRAHRPVKLLAWWKFRTKREALQTEYALKQLSRKQKLAIVANPEDLNVLLRQQPLQTNESGSDKSDNFKPQQLG
jgi:putative endonuclease